MFCSVCERMMQKNSTTGNVVFQCGSCGFSVAGEAEDRLIAEEDFVVTTTADMYRIYIDNAHKDPTVYRVFLDCPKCKFNIAAEMRFTTSEIVVHKCVNCGHVIDS